jgi:eukaryotic-like serine/threonine-protein kinase
VLVANDILSAKLIVQLRIVRAGALRERLRALEESEEAGDLVAGLLEEGLLERDQAELIRYYTSLFVHLRREATLLKLVERGHDLERQEVLRLLARVELSSYRHHLSAVLQTVGHLSPEEAERLERKTRRKIAKEDRRILERYRAEDFAGVSRALIPVSPLNSDAFRLTSLFRTPDTVQWVNREKEEIRAEERKEREGEDTREMTPRESYEPVPQDDESSPDKELELASKFDDDSGESDALDEADPAGGGSDEEPEEDIWKSRWATDRIQRGHWSAPAADSLDVPLVAIGRYQVVECIGKGGMGAVYLCQDGPGLVAIKVMRAAAGEDDDLRFAREGQIYALLDHPNLIHLLDQGSSGEDAFLVLPVFAGESLQARLDTQGPLEPAEAFEVMEQALAGLEAAHRQDIVHRDIKPDNLFLLEGPELQVKVIDFGIARFLDDLKPTAERAFRTELSLISGTPAFVAPETINSGLIDARTDIYSAGVMFFWLLTGRHPLHAERSGDYLSEHLVGIPLTLHQAKSDVHWPKELEALLASMLAKRPQDRPSSCQEILDLLQGGLRDLTLENLYDPPSRPDTGSGRLRWLFNQFFKHDR